MSTDRIRSPGSNENRRATQTTAGASSAHAYQSTSPRLSESFQAKELPMEAYNMCIRLPENSPSRVQQPKMASQRGHRDHRDRGLLRICRTIRDLYIIFRLGQG